MITPLSAQAAREDLTQVYKTGRIAFNKGDLVTAKAAFTKLLKADPDFELGKIYMAQIRYAEAQWEARPRSVKILEKARVGTISFGGIPLSDALELVRREVEKAGTGLDAGTIELITDLPADVLARPVSLSVQNIPMQWWLDAVAYTGGVRITPTKKGLSVTAHPAEMDSGDKEALTAALKMRQRAQDQVLPRIRMENTTLPEALRWLRQQTDQSLGPLIVTRTGVQPATVTLDLRNIPVSEAIRSIAFLADLDVDWCSWGAGLRPKTPAPAPAPAAVPAPDVRPTL
ncbi:MAG: hypothetical protein V4726_23660 [Verrucomicrobiota bacterium]